MLSRRRVLLLAVVAWLNPACEWESPNADTSRHDAIHSSGQEAKSSISVSFSAGKVTVIGATAAAPVELQKCLGSVSENCDEFTPETMIDSSPFVYLDDSEPGRVHCYRIGAQTKARCALAPMDSTDVPDDATPADMDAAQSRVVGCLPVIPLDAQVFPYAACGFAERSASADSAIAACLYRLHKAGPVVQEVVSSATDATQTCSFDTTEMRQANYFIDSDEELAAFCSDIEIPLEGTYDVALDDFGYSFTDSTLLVVRWQQDWEAVFRDYLIQVFQIRELSNQRIMVEGIPTSTYIGQSYQQADVPVVYSAVLVLPKRLAGAAVSSMVGTSALCSLD